MKKKTKILQRRLEFDLSLMIGWTPDEVSAMAADMIHDFMRNDIHAWRDGNSIMVQAVSEEQARLADLIALKGQKFEEEIGGNPFPTRQQMRAARRKVEKIAKRVWADPVWQTYSLGKAGWI